MAVTVAGVLLGTSITAEALPEYLRTVERLYNVDDRPNGKCNLCHTAGGGSPRNSFGIAFATAGGDENALESIESTDSDRDGINNLKELVAGTFPGDASSKPSREVAESALKSYLAELAEASGAVVEELPTIDEASGEFVLLIPGEGLGRGGGGESSGTKVSYILGGALDMRIGIPTNKRGADERSADGFVHVAEISVQSKVSEKITLIGELLLPLNRDRPLLSQMLANDHGFFYATISDLPYRTGSLWLGRYRLPYGVDAVLDGASNPLPTPVYRSLGIISDLAIMVKGFAGVMSYSLAVTDGVGVLPNTSPNPDQAPARGGERIDDWPIFGRLGFDLADFMPGLNFSLSGYSGRAGRDLFVSAIGRRFGDPRLVRKLRGAASLWYTAGRVGLYLEGESGQDILEGRTREQYRTEAGVADLRAFKTYSLYARARYNASELVTLEALGHYYNPNVRNDNLTGKSEAELLVGGGISYQFGEQVRGRFSWLGWFLEDENRVDQAIAQMIMEF